MKIILAIILLHTGQWMALSMNTMEACQELVNEVKPHVAFAECQIHRVSEQEASFSLQP